jgi:hypothetical protein
MSACQLGNGVFLSQRCCNLAPHHSSWHPQQHRVLRLAASVSPRAPIPGTVLLGSGGSGGRGGCVQPLLQERTHPSAQNMQHYNSLAPLAHGGCSLPHLLAKVLWAVVTPGLLHARHTAPGAAPASRLLGAERRRQEVDCCGCRPAEAHAGRKSSRPQPRSLRAYAAT